MTHMLPQQFPPSYLLIHIKWHDKWSPLTLQYSNQMQSQCLIRLPLHAEGSNAEQQSKVQSGPCELELYCKQ